MKGIGFNYLKTLFLVLCGAVFLTWQAGVAGAAVPLTIEGVTGAPSTNARQGVPYVFAGQATGGDGVYTFGTKYLPNWLTMMPEEGNTFTLQGTPENKDVGTPENDIYIWVTDGTGQQSTMAPFKITVKNMPDAPVITNKVEEEIVIEQAQLEGEDVIPGGSIVIYTPEATDPDMDLGDIISPPEQLTFSVTPSILHGWMEFVDTDGDGIPSLVNKEGRPNNSDVISLDNPFDVVVSVKDSSSLQDAVPIKIRINNVNDRPGVKFDPQPASTVNQDVLWTAAIIGSDPDLLLQESTETLKFKVEIRDETDLLKQTLTDGADGVAVATDQNFWIKDMATDTNNPKTKRVISGTPGNDDVGKYKISITVTDLAGASPLTPAPVFNLEVINVNDPPIISGTPASTSIDQADVDPDTGVLKVVPVAQGAVFGFKPDVVDVDNTMDELTFTTKNLPEWLEMIVNEITHEPSLVNKANRPNNSDVKTHSGIQICVDDYIEDAIPAACLTLPNIAVNSVNDAPVFGEERPELTVDQVQGTVIRGGSYNFNPPITDADTATGGLIIRTKLNDEPGVPDWLEFVDIDGDGIPNLVNKVNRPDNDDAGGLDPDKSYGPIDICVSDGKAPEVCMGAFTITVNNINDLPTISGSPVTSIKQAYGTFKLDVDGNPEPAAQGAAYNFTPNVSDIDDTLTKESYLVLNMPPWTELTYDAENKPSLVNKANRPNSTDVGKYEKIKFCVTDDVASPQRCMSEFSISVENVNESPTIEENADATKAVNQVTSATSAEKKAAGAVYLFTPTYSDPDNQIDPDETLTFSTEKTLPDWLEFFDSDGDGFAESLRNKENRPNHGDAVKDNGSGLGVYDGIKLCVRDRSGLKACMKSPFSITVNDINDPPVITPATADDPVTKVDFANEYVTSFKIDDLDGDGLIAWIDENAPDWIEMIEWESEDHKAPTTITLRGTPTPGQNGQEDKYIWKNVTVGVMDKPKTGIPQFVSSDPFEIRVITALKGDVNCDKVVDMADLILVLQVLAGMTTDDTCPTGDVNGDVKIGMEEAAYILQSIVLYENSLEKDITVEAVKTHLQNFLNIANSNSGDRASGTTGYDAALEYIKTTLQDKGLILTETPVFEFRYFEETGDPVLEKTLPASDVYTLGTDFATVTYSGSGDVTAQIVFVDPVVPMASDASVNTSTDGCEDSDFDGKDLKDKIAVIQRGTCAFQTKVRNAQSKGAKAVLIFNEGQEGRQAPVAGTLEEDSVITIPVFGISYDLGKSLYDQAQTSTVTLHMAFGAIDETREAKNLFAETQSGNSDQVVMLGAHLDTVAGSPGINDNGSGAAALLELAVQVGNKGFSPTNKLRFAWWAAEESGLAGSTHYVENLTADEKAKIAMYLNFDMIASKNYYIGVEDGNLSESGSGLSFDMSDAAISASGEIEAAFAGYFESQGVIAFPSNIDGMTDYLPFAESNIPFGGLFTGANGLKTEDQAKEFGGTAGQVYDACYHKACDNMDNISPDALLLNAKAMAYVAQFYADRATLFTGTITSRAKTADDSDESPSLSLEDDKFHTDRHLRSVK